MEASTDGPAQREARDSGSGTPRAVLFALLRPGQDDRREFFDWYEREHVSGRLSVPGFQAATRFEVAGQREEERPDAAVLVYDIRDLDVLSSRRYLALQDTTAETTADRMGGLEEFVRVTGEVVQDHGRTRTPGATLFAVAFTAPPEDHAPLEEWYAGDHVPLLLSEPTWRGVRVVRVTGSNVGWSHLALHELDGPEALDSPVRAQAQETPWRAELADRPWFGRSVRHVGRPVDRFDDRPDTSAS